jgi:predicted small integral membrane protein
MFVTGGISWLNLVFENVWLAMAVSVVWCGFMLGVLSAVAHLKSGKPKDME